MEPTPSPPEKDSAAKILSDIASQVEGSTPQVRENLIAALVQKELDQRLQLLLVAMQKRAEALGELRRIDHPDIVGYDQAGAEVVGHYSKERLKERKEKRERLAKIETAIEKALENDWSKLRDLK